MSYKLFSVESCMCLNFNAFCSCVRMLFLNQLRKPGPVVFAVRRGEANPSSCWCFTAPVWAHLASEVPLAVPTLWWQPKRFFMIKYW